MADGIFWNHNEVNAPDAVNMIKAGDHAIRWRDIRVGHIDTGLTRHSIFGDWEGANLSENRIIRLDEGRNFCEPDRPPIDPFANNLFGGHGTRTSSVLAADDSSRLVGIAPAVPVVPYRVADATVLYSRTDRTNVARAIRHAVEQAGCPVISISMGFPQLDAFDSRPMGEAVDFAYESGVIVVAAAGQVIDSVSYPGKFWRSIGVGGVKPDRAIYALYARWMLDRVDVWAPSQPIPRANMVRDGNDNLVEEAPMTHGHGTSYGTVHVSAAAAMWLLHRGAEIDRKYDQPWKRIEAFRYLLNNTGQDVVDDEIPEIDHEEGGVILESELEPITTRILDIKALLDADLPEIGNDMKKTIRAEDEIF